MVEKHWLSSLENRPNFDSIISQQCRDDFYENDLENYA